MRQECVLTLAMSAEFICDVSGVFTPGGSVLTHGVTSCNFFGFSFAGIG